MESDNHAAMQGPEVLILKPPERRNALLQTIRGAQRRLLLSIFRCEDYQVLDEIAAAVGRNVRVTALVSAAAKNWDKRLQSLELFLGSMGVEVRRYAGAQAKYHAKYLVADDEVALIASLNFTRKCFERTCDFILITHDPTLVSSLARLFAADCAQPPALLPEDVSGRLLVGPEMARSRFCELIGGARRSIRIIDHRVRDSEMVTILQQREAAGISVQILGQGDLAGMISHGKLMLVDDETAVVGSISLMRPSLNERREVAVVVEQPDLVTHLNEYFAALTLSAPGAVESAPLVMPAQEDEDLTDDL